MKKKTDNKKAQNKIHRSAKTERSVASMIKRIDSRIGRAVARLAD